VGNPEAVGERDRAEDRKGRPGMESRAGAAHRSAVSRPSSRRSLSAAGGPRRPPDHPADARPRERSADSALPERDRRGITPRLGGELEEPGAAAAAGVGRLMPASRSSAKLSRFCPDRLKKIEKVAPQAGFEPTTLPLT